MPPTPGDRIRALREALGLSYREAAKRGETITHGTIQNLEKMPGTWDNVPLSTLEALSRAYNVSLETITRIGTDKNQREDALQQIAHLEVHPDWMIFPTYGAVSAGEDDPEPLGDGVVYIPREHLTRRGANLETIRTYLINGTCMISTEARFIQKNYAEGDYIAVDYSKGCEPGDIVVAWWPDESRLVIKRYGVENSQIILYPIAAGRQTLTLPSEDELTIIGPVVWRGG